MLEYTQKCYDAEVIIRGLPFQERLPIVQKSHHHHGTRTHNEEIEQRQIDDILHKRWNSLHVESIKFTLWLIGQATDSLFYVLTKIFGFILWSISQRILRLSASLKPTIMEQAEVMIHEKAAEKKSS